MQAIGRRFDPVRLHQIYSSIAQMVEHLTVNQVVPGSIPGRGANHDSVAQLVRAPACHAGGRRFEPGRGRQVNAGIIQW